MRDNQPKPELRKYINGGKDPNYLVRSWASRLGSVTQGHKVPKSDYRSKWLQRLNRVELMQNVEVQQTLRNMMSILKAGDELIQDSDSAYQFAEQRRIEKCHEAVCKIRADSESRKRLSKPPMQEIKPLQERGTFRHNQEKPNLPISSFEDNTKIDKKFKNSTRTSNYDSGDVYEKFCDKIAERTNNNKLSMMQGENQDERKGFLPPIPEASQERLHKATRKEDSHYSLPTLDTASKFSIIKRAKELRNERDAHNKKQNLTLMSSQLHRRYTKARKISLKKSRKIELFGDNRKLLTDESIVNVVTENTPMLLPLLDSKSFSDIDCNDFLNVKNRLDGLSPAPAVLDHKLHWPTRPKHK